MPPHSPTEVVEDSDEELSEMRNERGDEPHGGSGEMPAVMAVDATGGSPNRSKRAREPVTRGGRTRVGRGTRHGDEEVGEDEDEDEPGRRPLSPGGDQPVTSREFRALLSQHFAEFSRSWQSMESRVAGVEHEAKTSRQERAILTSRVTQIERKEADLETKVHDLTKTVEDLKKEGVKHGPSGSAGGGGDPWAEYRARHGPVGARGDVGRGKDYNNLKDHLWDGRSCRKRTSGPSLSGGGCRTPRSIPSSRKATPSCSDLPFGVSWITRNFKFGGQGVVLLS